MDILTLASIGALFLGVFSWAFNISSRVSVQEQAHTDLKEWIEERTNSILKQVDLRADMTAQRLSRIENALNGYLKHE